MRKIIGPIAMTAIFVAAIVERLFAVGAVTIEDWRHQSPGTRGVPSGWTELPAPERWLVKRGSLEIIEEGPRRALRLRTDGTQHTIIRKKIAVDLRATPVLEWRWKIVTLPVGADLRVRTRSDSPAVLALTWRQPPRVLAYAWDVTAPVDSRFANPKQPRVHYLVVRSGAEDRGRWLIEHRDMATDYRAVFGEAPATAPEEIEISVDSNDTHTEAETLIGEIRVVAR